MREKKSMRKETFHQNEDVKLSLTAKHDEQERIASISKLSNDKLFTINSDKDGL